MSPELTSLLVDLEKALAEILPGEAPDLIGALRRIEATVEARMISALARMNGQREAPEVPIPKVEDRWLTPEEAAEFLGLTVAQLTRRRGLPRRKLGHRTIRYSLAGLKRHMARP